MRAQFLLCRPRILKFFELIVSQCLFLAAIFVRMQGTVMNPKYISAPPAGNLHTVKIKSPSKIPITATVSSSAIQVSKSIRYLPFPTATKKP